MSATVPIILHSQAYQRGGLLLITWDEATHDEHALGHISVEDEPNDTPEAPIGLIALSPYAKGHGYSNAINYTHSSTLLTIEEIFGLTPLLGDSEIIGAILVSTTPATATLLGSFMGD